MDMYVPHHAYNAHTKQTQKPAPPSTPNTTTVALMTTCHAAQLYKVIMAAAGWCFLVAVTGALAVLSCRAPTVAAAGRPTTPSASSSLDCGTMTSLLSGCASFVTRGGPLPAPGSPCCEGLAGLYAVAADSADNWRSVCRCMAVLVKQYWSNASAIAALPGLCGVSLGSAAQAASTNYCRSIP